MRLWRKRQAVDREQAMADVLKRHATRGGKLMPLAEYKHERRAVATQRRAVARVGEVLQMTPPAQKFEPKQSSGYLPPRQPSTASTAFDFDGDGPVFDESEEAKLRRRYGGPVYDATWWTS